MRTARKKSGFKAGLCRHDKSSVERAQEAPRHRHVRAASSIEPDQPRLLLLMIRPAQPTLAEVPLADLSFNAILASGLAAIGVVGATVAVRRRKRSARLAS